MPNTTTKPMSDLSEENVLRGASVAEDLSLVVNGYLVGKVGRRIEQTIATTNVAGDTAIFDFLEDGLLLYQITVVYTSAGQSTLLYAERTA